MVKECPADLATLSGLFDLFVWASLGLTMHSIFRIMYKARNARTYDSIATVSGFVGEQFYHLMTTLFVLFGCYANWRVYTCADWDSNGVGHGIFFFWTLAYGLTHLGWLSFSMIPFGAVMWVVTTLLGVANIVFSWKYDDYATGIHFALTIVAAAISIFHFYILGNRVLYYTEAKTFKAEWEKKEKSDSDLNVETPSDEPSGEEDLKIANIRSRMPFVHFT